MTKKRIDYKIIKVDEEVHCKLTELVALVQRDQLEKGQRIRRPTYNQVLRSLIMMHPLWEVKKD